MNHSYNHSLSANSPLTKKSVNRCCDGEQHYYSHQSTSTKTPMTFSIYLPDEALAGRLCPAILTCQASLVMLIMSRTKRISSKNVVSLA